MPIGKVFIFIGIAFILVGLLWTFIGKLPGDISFKRGNFSFHFPIVTSIIISIFLSMILYILGKIK